MNSLLHVNHVRYAEIWITKIRFELHDTQKLGMRSAQKKIPKTKIDAKSPELSISET